ncbi:MAG: 16S rRNA (cytosine(1402)-N(4))-methyltransferase RsmH [Oscillospiraceae bacterium]|jgi:16S rRNA (cytosine1402-N4)-methyltransferase|nr:16S rRNA (cytosine(1402)-N(4))-methyltransferase RsmH [Oscillospiraceae bacterium]
MTAHAPVLLGEAVRELNVKPDGIYLDGTCGLGGHSAAIAERLRGGKLISIDRDAAALETAAVNLERYGDAVTLVHGNFGNIAEILDELGIDAVDGMLYDLGVSSPQLDEPGRGFSYASDSAVDMRMDQSQPYSAYNVINETPEERLREILRDYGQERYAGRIARAVERRRRERPVATTGELAQIVRGAMPPAGLRERQNPLRRTFMAIRIAVNDELGELERMLGAAPGRLKTGGRVCVISFHSLEDRMVKKAFLSGERGCTCPREFPVCTCGFKRTLNVITKRAIVPGDAEIAANPRARSAKLRVAEKVSEQ